MIRKYTFFLSIVLLGLVTNVSAATLQHRYDFSTDVSDVVGSADGSIPPGDGWSANNATVSGGALVLDGGSSYITLPSGILAGNDSVTIEAWVTDYGSWSWARIYDFGNDTGTYMFMTPQSGAGTLRSAITIPGGGEQIAEWSRTRLPTGVKKQVVWTYDHASTTGSLYVDGSMVAQNTSITIAPSDMGSTSNNYLGKSQWPDPCFWGSIDEFRIYDGALTGDEVEYNYEAGPDSPPGPIVIYADPESQAVEEGRSVSFEIAYAGVSPVSIQWYRNATPISGATNAVYTLSVASLADNGVTFHAEANNVYLATPYTDTSSSASLTVTADTTAPLLEKAASMLPDGVCVTFSEPVDAATATNPSNYSICFDTGMLAVSAVQLLPDNKTVLLSTATLTVGTTYTVHVSNVKDVSTAGNAVAPDSQVPFYALPFVIDDIGNPAVASSAILVEGGLDLAAGGGGIGGADDQFSFAHNTYSGDFDVQVRIDDVKFADQWARAGLMARDGVETNDIFAAIFATPGPAGCQFMSRATDDGNAVSQGFFPATFPNVWLRLRRAGDLFEGFASLDGQTWQELGSATIAMSSDVEVGFAVTSGDAASATSVGFRDESVGGGTIVSKVALPFEPLGPSSRRGAMVISEIMIDPPSAWGGSNSLEFVELYNSGLITEDLTGHRFSGEIDYTFPDGTTLAPGQFLVVAKDPSAAQAYYGISCLGPYDGKLENSGGVLRFRNELDGILLEVEYNDKAPWPAAVFGTGHSMVLSHPSYGEGDLRAWSASDLIGGSPGTTEGCGTEPARGVVINEYLAHTDLPQVDYLELFNTGSSPVDLSGAWLSDEAGTNKYRIADGTSISARGFLSFDQNQLGFALSADGEQIFLVNSNQTRVVDAVAFRGQANGITEGRYPDGAPNFQELSSVTEGCANTAPLLRPVVINEIMYHPVSGSKNDEYIELYNRSSGAVDLSGWKLKGGISYEFPSNTVIAGHGYVVVAENATNLIAKYTQLNASNTYGNYGGSLGDGGDTVRLSMPEDLVSTNDLGQVSTNIYQIPVDEVTYLDGGRWGKWSDGGGSSLELIDPDADNRQPANWADSDETEKAPWTTIDVTAVLENGLSADDGTANYLEFYLQGAGEMLFDDLAFENNGGESMLSNGDFGRGSSGWSFGGVVRDSYVEGGAGQDGSDALHLVSSGRGDIGCNQADHALDGTVSTGGSNTGTIRAKVRWLKGSPYLLLRLRGNWMEVSQPVCVPSNCGTPGQVNSQRVANAGPAIYDVVHSPALPAAGHDVVVVARATDPDGISALMLHYRIDPSTAYSTITMVDDGTGGDAVAGDGLYSATISSQSDGTLAAFYVTASDGSATSQFPAETPGKECLVRWGETEISGSLGTYRLWVTADNLNFWGSREPNANDTIDATFVCGDRVIYNVNTMYSGSPFHTGAYNGPMGSFACDYEINFEPDECFLGSEPFVLSAEGSDQDFWFDYTTQIDLTSTWIGRKLGQQYNYRRHVNIVLNGARRGVVYLDSQQPNSEMLDEYHPNDSAGQLRKIEDWFEFNTDNAGFSYATATIERFAGSEGAIDTKRYRWNWRPRATQNHDQWFDFTNLVAAVNDTGAADYESRVRRWMDVRNFVRPVAVNRIVSNWDSYGYERGKNMYAYKPDNQGWRLLLWDIELALVDSRNGPYDPIDDFHDPSLSSLIKDTPAFYREYLMAFQEAVDDVIVPDVVNPILEERYANLVANGISVSPPSEIENWLAIRRSYLQSVLPSAGFSVTGPTLFEVSSNSVVLSGSAPLQVATVPVNDVAYPIEWTSETEWNMTIPLLPGTNSLSLVGVDRFGDAVSGANASLTVIRTDSTGDPLDAVVINEWMADNDSVIVDPADGDYEDWFELYNPGTTTVDLGGGYLTDDLSKPFNFQIPDNGHYVIPAGGYLLVWADGESVQNSTNQPDLHVEFSLSKGGESIGLYASDGREIDTVTFEAQSTDMSEGRCPSGGTGILPVAVPSPGSANSLPSATPGLGEISINPTSISFSWSSVDGLDYQVYYKDDLADLVWLPLDAPVAGTGNRLAFTNLVFGSPRRFYRIGYTTPSAMTDLVDFSINGSDISFKWSSIGGLRYQVFYKDDLKDARWQPIGAPVSGTGGTLGFTNVTSDSVQRFYQVGLQP